MQDIYNSLSFSVPKRAVFLLIFLFILVDVSWSQKANEDEKIELDEAFLNSLKTYTDAAFNYKIDSLFDEIEYQEDLPIEELYRELDLGTMYDSINMDRVFQNLDWNDAIGDVDWKELMKEVDWKEIRQGQSPGSEDGNNDMFNSSFNKQFINLEGFELPISAISKCMTFSPALMEAIDYPCIMKMMDGGGMESLMNFSPENMDAMSKCVDFSKMMDNMDWDCVFSSVDMNDLMKNYKINDFFKSVDTLNSNNRDEWMQEYLNKTPILKHINLDSFTKQLKINDELLSNPGDVHRMNKNFHSKVFSQLWSKMEGGSFTERLMNLFASTMVKYFGITTSSKRYLSFYKLIHMTALNTQNADYRSVLNSSILLKDLLIQAYFDNSFDSLSYLNENVRESIGENFEVNNLASVYQNIGNSYMNLGNFDEAIRSIKIAEQLETIFLENLQSDLPISSLLMKNYSKSKLEELKIQYSISMKWVDLQKFTLQKGRILDIVDEKIINGQFYEALTICKIMNDIILEQDSLGEIVPMFGLENKLMDNEFKSQMLTGLYKNMEKILNSDKDGSPSERYKYKMASITLEKFKHEQRLVFIYNSIGNVYMLRKQYSLSLDYQLKAWNLLRSLENLDFVHWVASGIGNFEKDYDNKLLIHVNIISSIAGLYMLRNEYKKAREFILDKAIPYMQIVNEREINSSIAKKKSLDLDLNMFAVYVSLARANMHLGNLDEAFDNYVTCEIISKNSNDLAYKYLYNTMVSQFYFKKGESKKALSHNKKSVSIAKAWNEHNALAVSYLSLAMSNFSIGDFNKAQIYSDSCKYSAKKNNNKEVLMKSIIVDGYLNLAQNKIDSADILFDKGIALFENNTFRSFQSHLSKQLSLESNFNAYTGAIKCALKQGKAEKAFKYVQKIKARTLNDQLKEGALNSSDVPNDLKHKRNQITFELVMAQNHEIISDRTKVNSVKINSLLKELEIVNAKIRKSSGEYSQFTNPAFPKTSYIRNQLNKKQAFIEYFVGDSIYAFVITKDKFSVFAMDKASQFYIDLNELVDSVNNINNLKNRSRISMKKLGSKLIANSINLYDNIFAPIHNSGILMGIEDLIIAPDSDLYKLPFELLEGRISNDIPDFESQFLGDMYGIHYYQSATIFANKERKINTYEKQDKILAVSKSNFGEYSKLTNLNTFNIESLKKSFGQVEILENDEATSDRLFEIDLSQYPYLHFSTHAVIEDIPELSYLALTNSQLSLFNIFNLNLNSKVTVLSACQTAKGAFQRGGGIMGFTRGLMYAGTESVVISLWPVEDRASEHLFNRFWANIASGDRPKIALQEAKQHLRTIKKKYDNPFYWAGFVLFGQG